MTIWHAGRWWLQYIGKGGINRSDNRLFCLQPHFTRYCSPLHSPHLPELISIIIIGPMPWELVDENGWNWCQGVLRVSRCVRGCVGIFFTWWVGGFRCSGQSPKKIRFFGCLPLTKGTFDTADNLTLTKKQECQKDKYQNECLVWWWQSSFALLRWFTTSNTLPVSSGYTSLIWTFLENLNLKSQFWEKVWILAILLTVKINQEKDFIMERCQSVWKFNFEVFTPWLSY